MSSKNHSELDNIADLLSEKYSNIVGKHAHLSIEKIIEMIITYYESIIDCMPGNVYWIDENAITVGCNKNVLDMFGFKSLDEFRGLSFEDMGRVGNWTPEATQSFKLDTLEVINTGKAKLNVEEPPIPHKNGKFIYFLSSRVPLFDTNGSVIGIVGISIDITERKQMEETIKQEKEKAEAANTAKTAFLENMRHDIRTPLSGIVGLAELIEKENDNNKIKQYTHGLVESSKELLRFLNEILETINVASGEIPLLKKKFNLKKILENVIKLHQPKANEKNLNLEFFFDKNIPQYLIGDPIRIYRIVLELLVNALKFTKEGYVKLSAKIAKKVEQNLVLQIEIEDTGPGIPVEKQQELFVRFKRLTPSYQGIYKGSGLGLAIVKQFIDDLQGEIHYVDSVNKGANFICLIPIKQSLLENNLGEDNYDTTNAYSSEVQLRKLTPTLEAYSVISQQKPYILIVEDQVTTTKVIDAILTKLGCKLDLAENGETAIQLAKQNHYDLIFMDIGLPDLDGYEVTKAIRLFENTSQHRVPIIGLTAHVAAEKKQKGLNVGMNVVLSKPLTEEMAIHTLRNYIPTYLEKRL